jgi:integrase
MARKPEGFTLHRDDRTRFWIVRFTRNGQRYKRSTRERNRSSAQEIASRIVGEVTQGRVVSVARTPAIDLDVLVGQYLVDISAELAPETIATYQAYFVNNFAPRFHSLESITSSAMQDYSRARLRQVKRGTVCKELSAMRGFLKWCSDRGYLAEMPVIKDPPARSTGTTACQKVRVDLDNDRAAKLIAALPEWSKRTRYPVRDLILFIWETALRRRTVQRLRCPEHWQPGATTLRIAEDIDKARFGREVELSEVAQALLNRHCDGPGLIWGAFDCRPALRNAARDAGCFTEQEIRHLSLHDLRHGALTELASVSPNLPGIAHIAGHKRVSTTTQYVHSNREQTRAVLKARPGIPVTIPVTDGKSADLNHVAEVLTLRNHNASEGGGIGRRAGFRFQCP